MQPPPAVHAPTSPFSAPRVDGPGYVPPPGPISRAVTAAPTAAKPLTREELIDRYLSTAPGSSRDAIAAQLRPHGVVEEHLAAGRVAGDFGHAPHWIQGPDGRAYHGRIESVHRPMLLDREGRLVSPAVVGREGSVAPVVSKPVAPAAETPPVPPQQTQSSQGFVDMP